MTTVPRPSTSHRLTVAHVRDDEFVIRLREHELHTDQPGTDRGMSPVELFVASLATCVAHYANGYLRRHDLSADDLRVDADYEMAADRPARVSRIEVTSYVVEKLTPQQKSALQAVMDHCTVHNTLQRPPEVEIRVEEAAVRRSS
ncbi:OsmC family protein [Lentzea sp. NPDC003310]|uniref:OsmC family protein n=1 Tax=Lentzea sp. NPDC003310 TaxID=3154447 RepID=UPI0033B517E8